MCQKHWLHLLSANNKIHQWWQKGTIPVYNRRTVNFLTANKMYFDRFCDKLPLNVRQLKAAALLRISEGNDCDVEESS